jgi:predicted DNA-binding transcriptional regulator AlpA
MIIVQLDSEQLSSIIQNAVRKVITETPQTEPPTQTDRWFDLNELCIYLPDKPSKATVYGWVHTGLIPCHKGQKKLRFLKSEIDAWLNQGRKKTLAETANEAEQYLKTKKGLNNGK